VQQKTFIKGKTKKHSQKNNSKQTTMPIIISCILGYNTVYNGR